MAKGRRKKKLLPVDTPKSSVLKALKNRMVKDIQILEKFPVSTEDDKLYPLTELLEGVKWLEWIENEKRNEEKRLSIKEDLNEE